MRVWALARDNTVCEKPYLVDLFGNANLCSVL